MLSERSEGENMFANIVLYSHDCVVMGMVRDLAYYRSRLQYLTRKRRINSDDEGERRRGDGGCNDDAEDE